MSPAVHETPEPEFCGHCGTATVDGLHEACAERLRMEPPRFCAVCRRRMTVQVSPTSWTARCVEHGEISTQTTAP